MAWIEVHQSLFDHRKLILAADALGMPEVHVSGHLIALWAWSVDNCPDGILPESDRVIARGARWDGDAATFRSALVAAGFVDEKDGQRTIHKWEEYAGKLIGQRKANADRQRRHRDRTKDETGMSHEVSRIVTVTSPSCHGATVQNPTQQDSTGPLTMTLGGEGENRSDDDAADAAQPKPQETIRAVPKPRATRIPDDLALTDDLRSWSIGAGLPPPAVDREFDRFRDYYGSKTERRTDWAATWRNWVRKAVDMAESRSPPSANGRASLAQSKAERDMAMLEAIATRGHR